MSKRDEQVERGRAAFSQGQWSAARAALSEADAHRPLDVEDIERLAWSCRWVGDSAGFLDALERAEAGFSALGALTGAARMALEQARQHMMMLDAAVALSCYVRATEYLEEAPESAEHARALWSLSFTLMAGGDFAGARAALLECRTIARRVGSPGMEAMAVQGLAHLAVSSGEVHDVLPLVDEAAALAMRPGVAPADAGYVYCAVISICRALGDWGRATEWTKVSTRYCERESIAGYTGLCRFHQGEIHRLHGRLAEAEDRVLQACEELLTINRYSAGWGYSELVEIRVRRGDLEGAEDALAQAVALGDDGQPGRARLLLAQGDPDAAVRSLRRSLADPGFTAQERRMYLLPLHVEASLAVGDEDAAADGLAQLEELVRRFETPGPAASAAVARGRLALHRGDTEVAITALRDGVRIWSELDAPYEAAQTRVLLARALTADGDDAGARLEREAATRIVREFGLAVDVDDRPFGGDELPPAARDLGLTAREVEVLALVAAGRTNRQIAEELFIAVKTASAHVSSVLLKLGAANRSEAGAIARRLRLD